MLKTCANCSGSGVMMGGGMMRVDCDAEGCESGFVHVCDAQCDHDKEKSSKSVKLDKRSKEYKQAMKELIKLGMTKEEAQAQLEA